MTAIKRGPWLIVVDGKDGATFLLGSVPLAINAEVALAEWVTHKTTEKWPKARAVLAIKQRTTRRERAQDAEDQGEG